jgi:replicative DNA helicase
LVAEALYDRPLPHDLMAERAVLGAVLLDAHALATVAAVVRARDFFRDAHRRIFGAMTVVQAAGAKPDFVTLCDELRKRGELDDVGGPAYIAALVDGMPLQSNVAAHAEIVREKARLRGLLSAANRLLVVAHGEEVPAARLVEDAVRELTGCVEVSGAGIIVELEAIRQYVASVTADEGKPLLTGYADLDALVGGVRPGELVVVAARPSVGKSSFALGLGRAVAQAGRTVLFCSLEMSVRTLAARLLAWESGVPAAKFERSTASEAEYARMMEAAGREERLPLYIEASARTLTEVGAWGRRLRKERELACLIVDYLQLLLPESRHESGEAEVASVVRALKLLAVDLDIPVVALSQLNRAPEQRRDKRPHVSDLRGSGAIEQACDLALLLFREEMYRPKPENAGIAEVIVAKNRNGPVGTVRLQFEKALAKFNNLEGA